MQELENQFDEDLHDDIEYDEYEYDEEVENVEAEESGEDDSELAPDSEPEHEENTEDEPEPVDKATEVINKKHRLWKEEQEKNARLAAELEQLRAQSHYSARPVIPELPDPFDDDYEDKLRQREQLLIEAAKWDAQQQTTQQYQYQQQQALQAEEQSKTLELAKSYTKRATEAGIKPQQLQQFGGIVGQYLNGNNHDHVRLSQRILKDAKGPLITQYLAKNPIELSSVADMDLLDAVDYINDEIKPKLAKLEKRQSKAPKPKKRSVEGVSRSQGTSRANVLKGASFS